MGSSLAHALPHPESVLSQRGFIIGGFSLASNGRRAPMGESVKGQVGFNLRAFSAPVKKKKKKTTNTHSFKSKEKQSLLKLPGREGREQTQGSRQT